MGSDINRGLLLFSERKPLGENGLYWFKIHLANKMDMAKKSFEERIEFVDKNTDMLRKMARDPLKHRDWLKEEECFQAIATMIEYDRILSLNELYGYDISEIETAMPVQIDGSCNGLQH